MNKKLKENPAFLAFSAIPKGRRPKIQNWTDLTKLTRVKF